MDFGPVGGSRGLMHTPILMLILGQPKSMWEEISTLFLPNKGFAIKVELSGL
jgi:hypothetical protein